MLARTLVLVPVLALATLDCGGKTDTTLMPPCPADGTCSGECKQTITDCMGTHELACSCDSNGIQQCDELGMPSCQADCNSLMHGQYTCEAEGEKCESPTQLACLDAPTLYCTCHSGTFVCDEPSPNCPSPPSSCPAPDQVKPGAACTGFATCDTNQEVYDCQGNPVGVVQCSCMNGTIGDCFSPPTPPCDADAGPPDGG